MAKVSTPNDAVQCNCRIILRKDEMVLDENPFENDTSYLLCPNCKLALFVIETDCSDITQKPIVRITEMSTMKSQITKLIKRTRNRPHG